MTTLSPVYGFPAPELLVGSADGPNAFTTLNSRIDRQMTQFRASTTFYSDLNLVVGQNQQGVMYHTDVAISVKGWIEVGASLIIGTSNASTSICAGTMSIRFGAGIPSIVRYHNQARISLWTAAGSAAYPVMTGQTTVSVDVLMFCDTASSVPATAYGVSVDVRQYGAPATG